MIGIDASQTPLERKTFNKHLDGLMTTGQLNPDILWYCDSFQQGVLNEVKKSLNRLEKDHAEHTGEAGEDTEGTESTKSTV